MDIKQTLESPKVRTFLFIAAILVLIGAHKFSLEASIQ